MDLDLLKKLWNNEIIRSVIILAIGITVGAVFYPSKHVEETVSKKYESEISALKQSHSQELQSSNEQLQKVTAESAAYHSQADAKISQLTSQVSSLQSKKKVSYSKIIHPDGTIEIKQNSESDTNSTSQVVTQLQSEYQTKMDSLKQQMSKESDDKVSLLTKQFDAKEQDYKKQISDFESKKVVDVNAKKFGLEGGMLNDKDYYLHATGDIWGPVFIGVQGEAGPGGSKMGLGLGIRF